MLEVSRMHQSLKETFQTLTVMVPTDMALQRLPQNQLRRILNDETLSKGTYEIYIKYQLYFLYLPLYFECTIYNIK